MVTREVTTSESEVRRGSKFTNMSENESLDLVFERFMIERVYEDDGTTEKLNSKGKPIDYISLKFKDLEETISLRWQVDLWKIVVKDAQGVERDTFERAKGDFNDTLRELYSEISSGTKLVEAVEQLNKSKKVKDANVRITVRQVRKVLTYTDSNGNPIRREVDRAIKDINFVK